VATVDDDDLTSHDHMIDAARIPVRLEEGRLGRPSLQIEGDRIGPVAVADLGSIAPVPIRGGPRSRGRRARDMAGHRRAA